MGNIVEKISDNKYETLLGFTVISLGGLILYQRVENQALKNCIEESMKPKLDVVKKGVKNELEISQYLKHQKRYPIFRIAITGGPCGGKSTSLEQIQKHFSERGWKVLVVPEVPTIVSLGGGFKDWSKYDSAQLIRFQGEMVKYKIYLEDYITRIGQMSQQPCLILCDRGLADFAAYMSKEQYQGLRDQYAWTWSTIRDRRYDSVIFLNSAAVGAEEFYTKANNLARRETAQEARILDAKTLDAWVGHPHMTICENAKNKSFQDKMDKALRAVQKTIGILRNNYIYHKILVEKPIFPENLTIVQHEVIEYYLKVEDNNIFEDKIRRQGQNNSFTYQRKIVEKADQNADTIQVFTTPLNSLQFVKLVQENLDPYRNPCRKKRINFAYYNFYYTLDVYEHLGHKKDVYLLRFETEAQQDPFVYLPDFITGVKNVKGLKEFNQMSFSVKAY